jgi:hypothetical protein
VQPDAALKRHATEIAGLQITRRARTHAQIVEGEFSGTLAAGAVQERNATCRSRTLLAGLEVPQCGASIPFTQAVPTVDNDDIRLDDGKFTAIRVIVWSIV